jgi:hypothetical protein
VLVNGSGGYPIHSVFCLNGFSSFFSLSFLALIQSIALPLHFDDMDPMGKSIQQRTGKPLIPEDLWPFTKRQIGGDDQRGAFVALGEKAK